ncbi:MAG: hypothetical protein CMN30_29000 [Sandaracinus sp.]|nr:hypothetical protein [Sandaracinus sp.]
MRWRTISLAVAGVALLASCGASTRMVHQSSYYFERCHAADLDEQRTVDERQACWAAWLRHWSGAQPPVRVRYAEQRLAALSRGEAMAPLPRDQRQTPPPAQTSDVPTGSAQVLVDASGGGPPQIELAPASEPAEESIEATAETPTAASPATTPGDPYTPPRPGPPPPPPRELGPPPPPRAPVAAGTQPCTDLCNPRWDLCVRRCGRRGAPCENACRSEYRVCMGACR